MKKSRAAVVTGVSASLLTMGWAAGQAQVLMPLGTPLADPGASAPSTIAPSPQPTAPATAPSVGTTPMPSTAPVPPRPSGTFDGPLVDTQIGSYQAQITVKSGQITDVVVLVGGDQRGESKQINGYALPVLISSVLSAQTWDVAYVSGASYSSYGFTQSVRSAMIAAGLL